MNKKLLVLSCSQAKRDCDGFLPALDRYDGPPYRVLRKFLRDYQWPPDVSIGVLSARYGLIGILKGIENYDTRMDAATARAKASECSKTLKEWATYHQKVYLSVFAPPADEILNRRLAAHSLDKSSFYRNPYEMELNPYTYSDWNPPEHSWAPARFTVFSLKVKNYEFPKVWLDPAKISPTAANGRQYGALSLALCRRLGGNV